MSGTQVLNLFSPMVCSTVAAAIYTLGAGPATLVLGRFRVRFTNTDSGAHAVTAYGVPSGGSAGAATCFLNGETIAPNQHLDVDVPVLTVSGALWVKADAGASVTIHQLDGILFS